METGFPTRVEDILARIDAIEPISYGTTRNFIDGAIDLPFTRISPLSRSPIYHEFPRYHQPPLNQGSPLYRGSPCAIEPSLISL